MKKEFPPSSGRRSFFTRLSAGAASIGAMAIGGAARAQAKPQAAVRWKPTRHEQDDWLDKLPGKHRVVFDTTTYEGLGEALAYAGNYMRVNRSDYGLQNADLAVVIVVRHRSAAFGYNDAMWAKYGKAIAARAKVEDPKTKLAPTANIYDMELDALFKLGIQLAVCSVSTRANAALAAESTGGTAEAVFNELSMNLVSNARLVPAGIVAINRAQERGYSLVSS